MTGLGYTTHNQPSLDSAGILPRDAKDIAVREWHRLTDDLARVRAEIAELRSQEHALEAQVEAWNVILSAGVSGTNSDGDVSESHATEDNATLATPQESADAVVDLLREIGEPMHYSLIYDTLRSRGMEVRGKNPPSVLLSRFFGDARLERVGQGTYQIKAAEEVQENE